MYAHQIIDDFNDKVWSNLDNISENKYAKIAARTSSDIKNSIKFHIEDANGLYELFNNQIGKRGFIGEFYNNVMPPYNLFFIDWKRPDIGSKHLIENKQEKSLDKEYFSDSSKRSVLVEHLCGCIIKTKTISYSDSLKKWFVPQYQCFISIGKTFGESNEGSVLIDNVAEKWLTNFSHNEKLLFKKKFKEKENVLPIPLIKSVADYEKLRALIKEDDGEYTILGFFMKLINCKNISKEKNYPPLALNKKRIKQGKQPLFTYHTLVVNPIGAKNNGNSLHGQTGIKQRLHFCRGHFKEYTESNKLFGKHTGLYWWQPMVRGNKELGIVHKDYIVKSA